MTHANQRQLHVIFAHGIVDGPAQADRFKEAFPPQSKVTAISFDDAISETGYGINRAISIISTALGKPVNRSKMYMGQDKDIEKLARTVSSIDEKDDIILYGCSRGSAAIINYLGTHNPKNIKAVVLDAAPANMLTAIHPILAKLGIPLSWDETIFRTLFPAYPKNNVQPIDALLNIQNKNIPLCFIHSETDNKVPYEHALCLYQKCKDFGLKNSILITIPQGKHSFLLQDASVKQLYIEEVHAFYKLYGINYNKNYDQSHIKSLQPSKVFIAQAIKEYTQDLQDSIDITQTAFISTALVLSAALIALTVQHHKKIS